MGVVLSSVSSGNEVFLHIGCAFLTSCIGRQEDSVEEHETRDPVHLVGDVDEVILARI